MKTCTFRFLCLFLLLTSFRSYSQVKIGDNVKSINPNSLLELESNTKGLLLPRLTNDQIAAMTGVPTGMLLFSITDSALYLRKDTGWAILVFRSKAVGTDSTWARNGNNVYNRNGGNVGIGTSTPTARLQVVDSSVVFNAIGRAVSPAGNTPVSGEGRRMLWYADKAAFRVGYARSNEWDSGGIGKYSFAAGFGTRALDSGATAFGSGSIAYGMLGFAIGGETQAASYAFASGNHTSAVGQAAATFGRGGYASGDFSMSMGDSSYGVGISSFSGGSKSASVGKSSFAFGFGNVANGDASIALGNGTSTAGAGSFTAGNGSKALAAGAAAFGDTTTAYAESAFVTGYKTQAGLQAFATGRQTSAVGTASMAVGNGSTASGVYSTAIGDTARGVGLGSFATGHNTTAVGSYSSVAGNGTTAVSTNEMVTGSFNTTYTANGTSTDRLFTVANGTDGNSRSNAMVVLKNGNIGVGISTPITKLHVVGVNPLTLNGVQTGTNTTADSLLTINNGIVQKLPVSNFSNPSSIGWTSNGNTVSTASGITQVGISLTNPYGQLSNTSLNVLDNEGYGGNAASTFAWRGNGDGYAAQITNASTANGRGLLVKTSVNNTQTALEVSSATGNLFTVLNSGNVGIGTATPGANAKVEILGGALHTLSSYRFMTPSSEGNVTNNTAARSYSLYTSDRIWCGAEINVTSDERTKMNIATSGPMHDLQLINKLRVVKYNYKDRIAKGNNHITGFLAQQVEQVMPDAVTKNTGVLPNIYQNAATVLYDVDNKSLRLTLPRTAGIKQGDTVKIITDDGDEYAQVSSVNGNQFTVANWQHPADWAFVYGILVHDVRNLDYNKIFSAGIGAIQQLSKDNEKLKKENSSMKKENAQMQQQLQMLAGKVSLIEKQLSSK